MKSIFNYSLLFLAIHVSMALSKRGLIIRAITPEIAKLEDVPEYQRSWYVADGSGKFKVDLTKVETEDVTTIKGALETTRKERDTQKRIADEKIKEALKAYDGLDPVKMREIMSKFSNEEEATLIAAGKIDQVIEKRMEKAKEALVADLAKEKATSQAATDKAGKYMARVLDNEIRSAVSGKVHDSALKSGDVLRAAREIFSLDENGNAVQLDKDGEIVFGKDTKTPFSPEEWLESMKLIAPHWFPSGGSGGGARGDQKGTGTKDMGGMTPQQRMTAVRNEKGLKK